MKKALTLTACALLLSGAKLFAQLAAGTTYPINGTANPPSSFATIQAAATYLATSGVSGTGNVVLELQTGYNPASEPATGINFDTIMNSSATRRVVLRPATGFTTTISGSVAGNAMLSFRGTRFLTVDGRQGGTGAIGLTVNNTSTATTDSTSTVRFVYGVQNVVFAYCNVTGSSKSVTNGGVMLIGNSSATTGNQVTIDNCNINGNAAAHNGITINGSMVSTALENANDTIRNCNIFDFFDNTGSSGTAGIRTQQGAASTVISGNSIYQTASRAYTAQFLTFGIIAGAGTYYTSDNLVITNNYIGGSGPLATGTMVHTAASVVAGYSAMFLNYGANAVVTGNTIKNITVTGNSSAGTFTNPAIFVSLFYTGIYNISNNTIDSFQVNNSAGPVTMSGIHLATQLDTTFVKNITPFFTVNNNSIKNLTAGSLTTSNGQVYGIRMVPTSTTGQGGNLYFNNMAVTASSNTIDGLRCASTTISSYVFGIWGNATNSGTSTHFVRLFPTITSNTIRNISCAGAITAVGYPVAGGVVILNAHTGNALYADSLKIRNNTIYNLFGTNTGDLSTSVGAIFTNLGRPDIRANKIYNIYNAATAAANTPYVYGVNMFNLVATSSVDNNYISLGDTATNNQSAYGIIQAAAASFQLNTYYNSILLSGSALNRNSACILRGDPVTFANNATLMTLNNNLLINRRTGSGANVAIAMPGTNPVTSDNNTMITTSASSVNYWNTAAVTFAGWKSGATADMYSYYAMTAGSTNLSANPANILLTDLFTNATYSSQADLQIKNTNAACWLLAGKGTPITGYAQDFAGSSRNVTAGFPTSIGANEFTTTTPAPNNVISGNTALGDSTMVSFAGRDLMKIYWLTGTLPGSFSSQYYSGKVHPNYTTGNKGASYYTFAGTGGSAYKYKMMLNYGPFETGSITNSNSTTRVAHFKSTVWALGVAGSANTLATPQTVITDSLNSSVFTINSTTAFMLTDNVAPLPVELFSFTGIKSGKSVNLDWSTSSEINHSHFVIERSADQVSYTAIGKVKSAGNSNRLNAYAFIDAEAAAIAQPALYYRLKMVDMDGSYTYSNVVVINFNNKVEPIHAILPNPFENNLNITVDMSNITSAAQVKVIDLEGRVVVERNISASGMQTITLDEVSALVPGVYHLVFTAGDESYVRKIVKLKN